MGIKISDMTPDDSIGGSEMIPVSDAGSPKRIDPGQIKDYTIDQIEAISAAGSVTGADGVFILQGGALKPVDIDVVAQHAIDTIWGKGAEATPDNADVMALKDGGATEKTVTLAILAEYIRATIEADILDVSDLDAVTPAGGNHILLTVGTAAKRCTFSDLVDAIYDALDTYVTALTAVSATADTDVFYVIQGGTEKKVTLAQILAHIGSPVTGPGSTTENYVPQWSSTTKDLKDGLALVTGAFGAGSSGAVATTESIRGEMDAIVFDSADIGADLLDADAILVDDGNLGTTQRKSTFARIWTWVVGKLQAVTDLTSYSWMLDEDDMASDDPTKTASQQSIKAYLESGAGWDGDIEDIDLSGGTDINNALADADLILVDDGAGGTMRKSAVSRIKTYMQTTDIYDTIWVPASQITPTTTDGADTEIHEYPSNDMNHEVLLYDGLAQDEHADFDIVLPDSWDLGTLKFKVYWSNGHADANTDEYVEFFLAAGARSNDDALDATLGSAINVEDQLISDDDLHVTGASAALTIGGTPILGDMIHFKLSRDYDHDGGGTAMDVDARVFGVLIQYKKNVATALWS